MDNELTENRERWEHEIAMLERQIEIQMDESSEKVA